MNELMKNSSVEKLGSQKSGRYEGEKKKKVNLCSTYFLQV